MPGNTGLFPVLRAGLSQSIRGHGLNTIFSNPFWHALLTEQSGIAIGSGRARRYPANVLPFAGVQSADADASDELSGLLQPGELVYVVGNQAPDNPTLRHENEIPGWQMQFIDEVELQPCQSGSDVPTIRHLRTSDGGSMVALTDKAFPGFFRSNTHELGSYYGIYRQGELIAMAGERLALPGYRELSAICTHPEHVGNGYAGMLIRHLLAKHFAAGISSFLHVATANDRATGLYERLGFAKTRQVIFHAVRRT